MSSEALNQGGNDQPGQGLCQAGSALVEALNAGGCEANQLASLLEVLIDHLDQVGERTEPLRGAELAADVTRIAQDWTARMSGRMFAAEERCCTKRAAATG